MSPVKVPDSFPEPMGTKEACEVLGVKPSNLLDTLRVDGILKADAAGRPIPPGPWKPGCRFFSLSRGAVFMAEDIRWVAEQRRERERQRRERRERAVAKAATN